MREGILRDLATRAATDPAFLKDARSDPEGTLSRHGYDLTADELRLVRDLRRRTAAMGDGQLAQLLAGGLGKRGANPPSRPTSPARSSGIGPAKPARPGGLRRRDR